jgi:mannose-1-phosphate guanylyltransferase
MIAVILVGGFGTRLRPLTCTRPKQLLPLGNTTLIEYMIGQLENQGVKEIVLAVGYHPDSLQKVLGDGEGHGVTIHYSLEDEPLGTAGPIRQAERYLRGSGRFLVLNGDIVSDLGYQRILASHDSHKATASIALYRVDNPSRYGVVDMTPEGWIRAFIEKPPADAAPSNLINAGCYVLDESVLDLIPSGRKVSIEREVFPELCEKHRVYGWEHRGLWIDTGTPASYLTANSAVLAASMRENKMALTQQSLFEAGVQVKPPVVVGKGTTVAANSVIGPNVAIGRNVRIGGKTQLRDSIVFDNTTIGEGVVLEQSVIGQGARIGAQLQLKELTIVGDGAVIDAGVAIPPGTRVCPNSHIREDTTPSTALF